LQSPEQVRLLPRSQGILAPVYGLAFVGIERENLDLAEKQVQAAARHCLAAYNRYKLKRI